MSFLRSSWRAVVGASGLGLLLPGGLLLALGVAATVSGVGGLGADLRQVLRGPEVPAASAGTATVVDGLRADASRVPEIPRAPDDPAGDPPVPPAATGTPDDDEPGREDERPDEDDPDTGEPDTGGPDTPPTTTTAPPPTPTTTTSGTPPPPAPGPVRQLGGAVADTVRPVPVAGPPAADAVQSVVDLVDPPPGDAAPPPVPRP